MTNETADRKGRIYPVFQEKQVFPEKNEAVETLGGQGVLSNCFCRQEIVTKRMEIVNIWLNGPKRTQCFARETLGPIRTFCSLGDGILQNRLIYAPACTHHEI